MNYEVVLLKELSAEKSFERIPLFCEKLRIIKDILLNDDDIEFLTELYFHLKDISCRNFILQALALRDNNNLYDFFLNAFKRERYLDMKLTAIRGYANYATEQQVEKLMSKFTELLIKRQEATPYGYEEYECLRSVFGLPYLIKTYKYKCFIDAYELEEKLYESMPEAFKGYFTLDEKGNHVELMNSEQIKKKMDDFFSKNGKNCK